MIIDKMCKDKLSFKFICAIFIISSCNLISISSSAETMNYNKSWIRVDSSNEGKQLISGQTWQVPVEYYLDPSEHSGTTTVYLWGTGPWIDTPDGKYATERGHIGYPNMSRLVKLTSPGRGRQIFTFTVPHGLELVKRNNPVLLIAGFRDKNGKDWPWQIRVSASFIDNSGFFDINTDVPGNLFTYNEPVRLKIRLKDIKQTSERKSINYVVYDTTGAIVTQGRQEFTAEQTGQEIYINLNIQKRGTFLIEIDIPGWEKRYTTFARIPDLKTITMGKPTCFGITTSGNIKNEQVWAIGQRLGFSICRHFTKWYNIQPAPDIYNLDQLEQQLETANKYGIQTWLCLVDPPPFAFNGKAEQVSYKVFDCNLDAWRDFVAIVTTRLKGKLYGWEWLNELTPGGYKDQVETYLQMCKIGTETAKGVDSNLVILLAGGLFPRSFRNQVLSSGVGKYIDVLPVHYQNGNGVMEALHDLDLAGYSQIAVWDNESAAGLNAWAVPPLEELQNTEQCDWILKQWTDELEKGCEKIIYFGGIASVAGNYGYMLDDYSPRPVAASIAVFTSKLAKAKPLGTFLLGKGGLFHLFERDNKPILVASTYEINGEKVLLNTGDENIKITDYQGNESFVLSNNGKTEIPLNQLPFFIEQADLDILKAYLVPEIQVTRAGSGTSANTASDRQIIPYINILKGSKRNLFLNLKNTYNYDLSGNIIINLPEIWPKINPIKFSLKPSEETTREILLDIPSGIPEKDYEINVILDFDQEKLPTIEKQAVLTVISPKELGNLVVNGDFESPVGQNRAPEGWSVNNTTKKRISSEGLGDGLGKYVLKFENSDDWVNINQNLKIQGGQTYLYTAWVRNENMSTGSNMTQFLADGTRINLYDTQVFSCGSDNPYWQMFTCRKQMPINTESVSFAPFAKGQGRAMWDNIRVTLFEGTDYAAEAYRTFIAPKIDGLIDEGEWITKCPIPLIGRNQISYKTDTYEWTPDNLSATGYLMWDDDNLYITLKVRDNLHYTTGSGSPVAEDYIEGDSVILGIDPTHRGAAAEIKAFAYYISSASPGGGSGSYTLFRPENHSGTKLPGQLFRDSSIYNLAILQSAKGGDVCIYELSIPLSEIGIIGQTGTKAGLSIQLNDNDGTGKTAQINWGNGLYPKWTPENFGVVTFIE